jgi:small-conductance mechanosensitive channel
VAFIALACVQPALAQQPVGASAAPPPATAPVTGTGHDSSPLAQLDPIRLQLDQVEASIGRDGLSDSALAAMRNGLEPLRTQLHGQSDGLARRLADITARLKELGAAPAAGAAPENAAITAERNRLTLQHADLDAASKQTKILLLRVDNLADRLVERRRELFARELFTRTSSALDPTFWKEAIEALPAEARGVGLLLRSWASFALDRGGVSGIAGALFSLAAFAIAATLVIGWVRRRARALPSVGTPFNKASLALIALLRATAVAPLIVLFVVLVLDAFNLMPASILDIGIGLSVSTAVASFGRGVALGLFAPFEGARRLWPLDDSRARLLADHFTLAARILGVIVFINILQHAIVAPLASTIATSALLSILVAGLLMHLLVRLGRFRIEGETPAQTPWLRMTGWAVVVVIIVSLVTGYIGFATFIAGRLLVILAALGALYILLLFTDALFSEVLTGETPRGQAVAAFFGLRPRGLDLIGTLASAVLRLLLILFVVLPLIGPWGLFAADFFGVVREATWGLRIGDFSFSLAALFGALAALLIGVLATRAAQAWLKTRFLPRTSLEPSLQHSVATIFGYLGVVAALALALAALGIDLQKITLVAGALSIGIGFGLQSVVSNFVSGLILLTERPIRVGDMIVVKGEEGFVRQIRVRATEIETFERASVIIPNSELITGVVKNWTHANTLGRIIVKVGVGYDSDADEVRAILLSVAQEHPQILQSPGPQVYLANFGDSALEFELRCVVANVQEGLVTKSDLHMAILRRFRAAGITIPYPQREVSIREAVATAPEADGKMAKRG